MSPLSPPSPPLGLPPPSTSAWRPRRPTRQWRLLLISLVLALGLVAFLEHSGRIDLHRHGWGISEVSGGWGLRGGLSLGTSRRVKGLRVAVVEPTGYHSEVLTSVLSTLDDLGINSTAYTFERDINTDVAVLRPGAAPRWAGELGDALAGGEFDVVVLSTCDAKFWRLPDRVQLFSAVVEWATRAVVSASTSDSYSDSDSDAAGRTAGTEGGAGTAAPRVICIPHEIESFGGNEQDDKTLDPLAAAGRLDFLALAPHASAALAKMLHSWSARLGRGYWEKCAMGVEGFVPVFPLPAQIPLRTPREGMHKAGIVRGIRHDSRDYDGIFKELEQAILHNPTLWGYNVVNVNLPNSTHSQLRLIPMGKPDADNPNPQRVVDYTNSSEAFTLHLIGYAEERPAIPPLLNDAAWPVVRVVEGDVEGYYGAIRDMDIIVPAFADDASLDARASASVPAALMAETPLLVTTRHLQAYTYLDLYAPTHITHPLALDAVNALGTLRRGEDPWSDESSALPPPVHLADWDTTHLPRDWAELMLVLRRHNARVWARVLVRSVESG